MDHRSFAEKMGTIGGKICVITCRGAEKKERFNTRAYGIYVTVTVSFIQDIEPVFFQITAMFLPEDLMLCLTF